MTFDADRLGSADQVGGVVVGHGVDDDANAGRIESASSTARAVRTTSSAVWPAESIHDSTRAASAASRTLIRALGA